MAVQPTSVNLTDSTGNMQSTVSSSGNSSISGTVPVEDGNLGVPIQDIKVRKVLEDILLEIRITNNILRNAFKISEER
jgi:hypothetical protein